MKKRVFSILLCIAVILGMYPGGFFSDNVNAEENLYKTENVVVPDGWDYIEVSTLQELKDALAKHSWYENNYHPQSTFIRLTSDINVDDKGLHNDAFALIYVCLTNSTTIDFNGHTITGSIKAINNQDNKLWSTLNIRLWYGCTEDFTLRFVDSVGGGGVTLNAETYIDGPTNAVCIHADYIRSVSPGITAEQACYKDDGAKVIIDGGSFKLYTKNEKFTNTQLNAYKSFNDSKGEPCWDNMTPFTRSAVGLTGCSTVINEGHFTAENYIDEDDTGTVMGNRYVSALGLSDDYSVSNLCINGGTFDGSAYAVFFDNCFEDNKSYIPVLNGGTYTGGIMVCSTASTWWNKTEGVYELAKGTKDVKVSNILKSGAVMYMDGKLVDAEEKDLEDIGWPHTITIKGTVVLDDIDFKVSKPVFHGSPNYTITPSEGNNYITQVKWTYLDGDSDKYVEMSKDDIFHSDTNYRICITIKAKDGGDVIFRNDLPVSINGEMAYSQDGYYFMDFSVPRRTTSSVTVPGGVSRGEKIYESIKEPANASIEEIIWYKNGEEITDKNTTVSQGKYYAYICLKSQEDYRFTEDVTANFFGYSIEPDFVTGGGIYAYFYTPVITITCDHDSDTSGYESNGESHWHKCSNCAAVYGIEDHDFDSGTVSGSKTTYTCKDCGYKKVIDNGKECIDWIILDTKVGTLAVGDKLPEVNVKDCDSDKYTLTDYQWKAGTTYENAVNVSDDEKIVKDKKYYLTVNCTAKQGYYIDDEVNIKVLSVNAQSIEVNSDKTAVKAQINNIYPDDKATADIVLPTMSVGKTMGEVLAEIKKSSLGPAGALGEIDAEFYIDGIRYNYYFSPEYSTDWKASSECTSYDEFKNIKVQPGTVYKLNVKLTPISYYVSEDDITVTNKSAADSVEITGDSSVVVIATAIYTTTNDSKGISFVNLSVDSPVSGVAPSENVAASANLKVDKISWEGTLKDGKFACDNEYTVKITVSADGEHYFNDSVIATVNGNTTDVKKSGESCIITYDFSKLEHDYGKLCFDEINHWKQCTYDDCDEKINVTSHSFKGDTCEICGYTKAAAAVEAESIALNKTSLSLKEGEVEKINAEVLPYNITDKTLTWESSNESVATVDLAGKITALSKGTAVITVKTSNNKTASLVVNVQCAHKLMEKTSAKSATCTKNGNKQYWYCKSCGKYFSDEKGINEIEKSSCIIKATGHKYKTISAGKGCTYEKCTNCNNKKNYKSPSYVKSVKVSKGKKSFTVKWKKQSKATKKKFTGYQIKYSLKSNMSGAKTVKVSKSSSSKKISKLKGNKKYYIEISSYVKINGKIYYSKVTKKTVKTSK